jgi:dTDP-4-amino-4,6-dideoxygalactose transaminase
MPSPAALSDLLVTEQSSIQDAWRKLEQTGRTVLLLVGTDGRLRRTVTDGDLRRLVIQTGSTAQTLASLPPQVPKNAPRGIENEKALQLMNTHRIDQLPLVDDEGRPTGVLLRRDIDSVILLSTPHMGEEEMSFIESAFRTNWVAPLGPNVDAFENELAAYVGARHAAALSSGTAAIHLALHLLGVGPGDTVFCSSLTFVATANPILYQGGTPVFIDSDRATWNMSPAALGRALADAAARRQLPKAVIVVNLYGQSADFDPILALCNHHGVPLVEDAAESLGATYRGRASGIFGRLGIFSFNGNKIITTSGGGMLVSDDESLIKRARFLATQARDPAPYYQHTQVGFNYRMSNILAGIGRGQLKVLEQRVAARRAIFQRYAEGLAGTPVDWMPEASFGRSNRWLSAGLIRPAAGLDAAKFIERLGAERIEARRVWKPLHQQPLFAGCAYYPHAPGESVSDDLFARGVCLPSGSNLESEQQDRIIRAIRSILGRAP